MPAIGKAARKAFVISRLNEGGFPAFSGTTGQISHDLVSLDGQKLSGEGALRVAAAWIANTVIADEVSSLAMKIIKRDDIRRQPVQPPELRALWDKPNPDQTTMGWQATNSLSLTLHGVSYNVLGWTNGGELDVMWPLPPAECQLERMDDQGLRLKVVGSGELENHPGRPPQFMMIPLYQLPGRLEPVSPVRYAAELLGLSVQYDRTASSLAARGFNPSAVVTFGADVPDPIAEKYSARLTRLHSGSNRAGGVAVMGGPDIKVQKWAMTLADAEFMAQNDRVFQLVMAIWRVPPTVAGMVDKPSTWGTGVAEFARGLERFTLRPIVMRLQAGYEDNLTKWVDPNLQVRIKFDSLLSANSKDRTEIQRLSLMNGMTSVERVLAQNDEPPFDETETVFSALSQATAEDRALQRLKLQAEAYGALIRAGVTPEAAAAAVGFDPAQLRHTGAEAGDRRG